MQRSEFDPKNFDAEQALLNGLFEFRKKHTRGYGIRQFARDAGFKSPGMMSMVLNGKRRLNLEAATRLAESSGLTGRRRDYFLAINRLSNAKSKHQEVEARGEILRLKEASPQKKLKLKQYRFLSNWYYPLVFSLFGAESFKGDSKEIAKKIGKGLTAQEVERAINDLLALELLREETGKLVQTGKVFETEDDVKHAAIHQYHRNSLKLADQGLELGLEDREYNGLTVCTDKAALPELKEKIRRFRKEIHDFLETRSGDDLIQLNIQLFRITEKEK